MPRLHRRGRLRAVLVVLSGRAWHKQVFFFLTSSDCWYLFSFFLLFLLVYLHVVALVN